MKDINRLKVVLVEQKRTGKWLAEALGKDVATVSRWCSNVIQPSVETFIRRWMWMLESCLFQQKKVILIQNKRCRHYIG